MIIGRVHCLLFGALFGVACHGAQLPSVAECEDAGAVHWVSTIARAGDAVGIKVTIPTSVMARYQYEVMKLTPIDTGAYAIAVELWPTAVPALGHAGWTTTRSLDAVDLFLGPLPSSPTTYSFSVTIQAMDSPSDPTLICSSRTTLLPIVASATTLPRATAPLVEFYNASLGHYFMTMNGNEIRDLDLGVHSGWQRTGLSFLGYVPSGTPLPDGSTAAVLAPGTAVSRYYAAPPNGSDSHFFTLDAYEEVAIESPTNSWPSAWQVETHEAFQILPAQSQTGECPATGGPGPGFFGPALTRPVYRLWNGLASSNHRYTTDPLVRQRMIDEGWIPEGYGNLGVVMCAPIQ